MYISVINNGGGGGGRTYHEKSVEYIQTIHKYHAENQGMIYINL